VVGSGADAIAAFERERFGLVFMDGNLPDMDGVTVAQELRRREQDGERRTPIIAMTAMAAPGDRERFLASGMDDYLPKPIDLDSLARTVERWARPEGEEAVSSAEESPAAVTSTTILPFIPPAATSDAADADDAAAADETENAGEPGNAVIVPLPTPEGPVLDRGQFEESCMGDADLRRVLAQTFISDTRNRLAKLAGKAEAGDARAVEFEAHGLKGMCATIGAVRCAHIFRDLEMRGREGNLEDLAPLLIAAEQEIGRVEGVLTPILDAA
jgi:CheY-like chemotaxis protein